MSNPKRILVVEDEVLIAIDMETALSELGHRISVATSLAEAQGILSTEDFDLGVVDYHLGDGTACAVVAHLRSRSVPFIVCSGAAGLEELREVLGGTTILAKPYTTDGLLAALRSADHTLN